MRLNVRSGLWDYAIPFRHGLIWGNQVVKYIRELVGGATFESLATPLHVVAAELVSGREVVLNTGPVAEAVRASSPSPASSCPTFTRAATTWTAAPSTRCPAACWRSMGPTSSWR